MHMQHAHPLSKVYTLAPTLTYTSAKLIVSTQETDLGLIHLPGPVQVTNR